MNEIFSTDPLVAGQQAIRFAMQNGTLDDVTRLIRQQAITALSASSAPVHKNIPERNGDGTLRAVVAVDSSPRIDAVAGLTGMALELAGNNFQLSRAVRPLSKAYRENGS